MKHDQWMFVLGASCYAIAFIISFYTLKKSNRDPHPIAFVLLISGFIIQGLALYFRGIETRSFPLSNPFEILQVLAWSAIALDLVIRPLFKLRLLNFFSSGLACFLSFFSISNRAWDYAAPLSPFAMSPWISFHAALAIFSYGIFAILGLTSIMYLIQHHSLTRHRSGIIFNNLPAIKQLEAINNKLVVFGVVVLTLSVAIGILNWISEPQSVSHTKLIVALTIWIAYVIVFWLRKNNRLIAVPYAWTCLILFVCVILSLWPLTVRPHVEVATEPVRLFDDVNN